MDEDCIEQCFEARVKLVKDYVAKKNVFHTRFSEANYCVINPGDYCSVGCSHCLYSSTPKQDAPRISLSQAEKLCFFLNQANLKQIVFSGGGEPLENLDVITRIIEGIDCLEEAVIITSGYFGEDRNFCNHIIKTMLISCNEKRRMKNLKEVNLIIRLSRDSHYLRCIPSSAIINVIECIELYKGKYSINAVLRTNIDDDHCDIFKISKALNSTFIPTSDIDKVFVVDGLPVCWMKTRGMSIPVIFKPTYFLGRSKGGANGYSLWNVVTDEIRSSNQFNLSVRGPRGQGHNCYQYLLNDISKIQKISSKTFFSTYDYSKKQIALYITADGRVSVNNGALDNFIYIKDLVSWEDFLKKQIQDPLQNFLLENGPLPLYELMKSYDVNLEKKVEKSNFVFSISFYTLENTCKRFILLLKILKEQNFPFTNLEKFDALNDMALAYLKKCPSKLHANSLKDPILGSERSIYDERQ